MFVDFDLLPPTARLWVYQANRPFTPGEERQLKAELSAFCDQWATHNKALRTSYSIERNQFLLMAVDDNHMLASGCSIDDSVHRVQEIGRNLGVDFFDRSQIAFLENDQVILVPLTELKSRFASGTLQPDQLTFTPQVTSKGEWDNKGLVPAEKSWVARFFPKPSLV